MKDTDQELLYLWYQQHKNYDLDHCLPNWVDVLRNDLKASHSSNVEDFLSGDQNYLPDYLNDNPDLKNYNSIAEIQPSNLNFDESKSSKVSLRRHSFPRSKNKTAEIALSLGLQPHDSVFSWGSMLTPKRQKETPVFLKSLSESFIEQVGSKAEAKGHSRLFAKCDVLYRQGGTWPMDSCDQVKSSHLDNHSFGEDITDKNQSKMTESEAEDLDEKILSVSSLFSLSRNKPICSSTPILPKLERLYSSAEDIECQLTERQVSTNIVSLSKSLLLTCTPINKGQATPRASVQTLQGEENCSDKMKTGVNQVSSQSPNLSPKLPIIGDSLSPSAIAQNAVRKFPHIKKKIRPKFIYPRIDEEHQSLDGSCNILNPMQSPGLIKTRLQEAKKTTMKSESNKIICEESLVLKRPTSHSIDEHKEIFQMKEEPNPLPQDTIPPVPESESFNCESQSELIKDNRNDCGDDTNQEKATVVEQTCETMGYDSNGKTPSRKPISTAQSNGAIPLQELELHNENPDLPILDNDWNNEKMTQHKVMKGKMGTVSSKCESSQSCLIDAEISRRSLRKLLPGEKQETFHTSSVLLDGTKMNPNQNSATLQKCTSKSEMPGFTTASGKGIKINPQLLLKAKGLWEEIETAGNVELTPGTPVANANSVMKHDDQQQTIHTKCPQIPVTMCFTTASGKGVQVNPKHVLDAKCLWEDIDSWDGNAELLAGSPLPIDHSGNKTSERPLNCTTPPEAPCFKTASGKGIQVNQELLLKSKHLWADIDDTLGENPNPLPGTSIPNWPLDGSKSRPNLASATASECHKIPQFPCFQTASGKGIKVNPKLILKAKRLWEEIDSSEVNGKDSSATPVSDLHSIQNENQDISSRLQKRSASPILGSQKSKRNIGPLNSSCLSGSQLFHQGCMMSKENMSLSALKERNGNSSPTKLKQMLTSGSIPKLNTSNKTRPVDYLTQAFPFPKPTDTSSIYSSTQEKVEINEITEAFVRDNSWDHEFAAKH